MEYKISIENFKSIVHTEFELKKGLNILIGPNGAGKTCVLNSLKFLKDILQKGVGLAMARAGGASRVFHRRKKIMKFTIELNYGQKTYIRKNHNSVCKWTIIIEQKGQEKTAMITQESLIIQIILDNQSIALFDYTANRNTSRSKLAFDIDPNTGKDLFDIKKKEYYRESKQVLFNHIKEELKQFGEHAEFKKTGDKSILPLINEFDSSFMKLLRFLTSITEYNIIPEKARQATEQLPFAKMDSNGFGISEVIATLEKRNFHKLETNDFFDEDEYLRYRMYSRRLYYNHRYIRNINQKNIVEALGNINRELAAAVRPIIKVSFDIDKTTGKRFVIFKSERDKFYPDEVSDGTIKWLCILTSIYVSFTYIYLLEEPENFLHPWMQQKLIQIMREQSKKSDEIYVLTTHSTTLLNSAFPNEILTVQQKNKGTVVERIKEEADIQDFLKNSDFRLGDLWVSGGIGAIPQ